MVGGILRPYCRDDDLNLDDDLDLDLDDADQHEYDVDHVHLKLYEHNYIDHAIHIDINFYEHNYLDHAIYIDINDDVEHECQHLHDGHEHLDVALNQPFDIHEPYNFSYNLDLAVDLDDDVKYLDLDDGDDVAAGE